MTTAQSDSPLAHRGLSGWTEAIFFACTLSVLNVAYGIGHQHGCHPIAFLCYAMTIAAGTLLAFTGAGPHWRAIALHPLSFVIGGGIIAMEAAYFLLLRYVPPADGSLLVRLNVPAAALLGLILTGRRTTAFGTLGHATVIAGIVWALPSVPAAGRVIGLFLAIACAFIMSSRAFAMEFHPWNRAARNIEEKVRLTGLVLLVSSVLGTLLVGGLMLLAALGILSSDGWLPTVADFLYPPTISLGLFMGGLVLTLMQYLAFSVVLKIRAENFVATTALIPLVTVAFQLAAIRLGILQPVPFDWAILPPMFVVAGGVLLVIWAGRRGLEH